MELTFNRQVSTLYSPSQNQTPYWINKFYYNCYSDIYGETLLINVVIPQAVYVKRTKYKDTYYGDEWISTRNHSEIYVNFNYLPSGDSFRLINRTSHPVHINAISSYTGALQPDTGYLVRLGGLGHNRTLHTEGMIGNNLHVVAEAPKDKDIFGLSENFFIPGAEGLGKDLYISLINTELSENEVIKIAFVANKDFNLYVGHYKENNVSNYITTSNYHQVSVSSDNVEEYSNKYFAYSPPVVLSQFRIYNGGEYESI